MKEQKKRVFSGIQPSGKIHIGNYLGAIRHWVKLQAECDCVYCVVDLHAITTPQDPSAIKAKTREVAGLLMAAGLDPKKRQYLFSPTSVHTLSWPGYSIV